MSNETKDAKKRFMESLTGWSDSATDLHIRKETVYQLKRIADALDGGILTFNRGML